VRCVTHDDQEVRTTLTLDDDVLQAAKELAASRGLTTGRVISDLARAALTPSRRESMRNGVLLLPPRASGSLVPTMRLVNDLRD
jgi:hypothetical protein